MGALVHCGLHTTGTPVQPVTPVASKACTRSDDVNASPSEIATIVAAVGVGAVQRGLHTTGAPEQPVCPCRSNVATPAPVPRYTVPSNTVGDVAGFVTVAIHSGSQLLPGV